MRELPSAHGVGLSRARRHGCLLEGVVDGCLVWLVGRWQNYILIVYSRMLWCLRARGQRVTESLVSPGLRRRERILIGHGACSRTRSRCARRLGIRVIQHLLGTSDGHGSRGARSLGIRVRVPLTARGLGEYHPRVRSPGLLGIRIHCLGG